METDGSATGIASSRRILIMNAKGQLSCRGFSLDGSEGNYDPGNG
jgi:hypothetical protein